MKKNELIRISLSPPSHRKNKKLIIRIHKPKIYFVKPWIVTDLIYKMVSEVIEEMLKRMQSHPGVVGTVILNKEGQVIKSTLDNTTSLQYAALATRVCDSSLNALRDIDATNDLTFLRVRSKKHEIMIAPDKEFVMVTIRNTTDSI